MMFPRVIMYEVTLFGTCLYILSLSHKKMVDAGIGSTSLPGPRCVSYNKPGSVKAQ